MAYGIDYRDCECVWLFRLVGSFVDEMSDFVFGGAHFPGRGPTSYVIATGKRDNRRINIGA